MFLTVKIIFSPECSKLAGTRSFLETLKIWVFWKHNWVVSKTNLKFFNTGKYGNFL